MTDGSEHPRVLLVVPYLSGVGGIERASRTLASTLADVVGPENVAIFSLRGGSGAERLRPVWVGPERLSLHSKVVFSAKVLSSIVRDRPDLVICLHVGQSPLAYLGSLLTSASYAIVCHGAEVWGPLGPLQRLAVHRAGALWAVSAFTASVLTAAHRVPPGRVAELPLAVIVDRTQSCTKTWHGGRLITVARLEPHKGVDVVIRAVSRLAEQGRPVRLTIVGEGSDRSRLEALVFHLGLSDRVMFLGRVSDQRLHAEYENADVFVLVSQTWVGRGASGEGFGLVYIEAALHGVPVIAGSMGGSAEAVVDGVTGGLVLPGNVNALVHSITKLLDDPEAALAMGAEGRRWASYRFSPERFRARLEELLANLVRP